MSAADITAGALPSATGTEWGAVFCMSLLTFVLVGSEFMPVSLLTPIARDFAVTEGQAGQSIAISGMFAIITSLFGNALLSRLDRRSVILLYTAILVASGLLTALASSFALFMLGRILVGIAIGGFWSLSTAILARLSAQADLPKAMALLQGGTALASVVAAPLGSFLGGLIGWRGAFLVVVPAGIIGLVWQFLVIPRVPPGRHVSPRAMLGLFGKPMVRVGMAATALAFMGQFTLSTYLRPFLENVTGMDVNSLSAALLGLGLGGLAGTSVAGFVLRDRLPLVLWVLPAVLALLALLLMGLGQHALIVVPALVMWGLFSTPIPVAWGTLMTRVIPDDLEAGGGVQVALVQLAITAGASLGGLLFDAAGWWSAFVASAVLLALAAVLAAAAGRTLPGWAQ
jgi:predicted MFS family arabinose efflux permease